jgi:NIMA (never in mitosis gene a)-related kinase
MTLKDFQILQKLGQGTFAKVYKAHRLSDNKLYALKQVSISIIIDTNQQTGLKINPKLIKLNSLPSLFQLPKHHSLL